MCKHNFNLLVEERTDCLISDSQQYRYVRASILHIFVGKRKRTNPKNFFKIGNGTTESTENENICVTLFLLVRFFLFARYRLSLVLDQGKKLDDIYKNVDFTQNLTMAITVFSRMSGSESRKPDSILGKT
jgi:hypothetical protein